LRAPNFRILREELESLFSARTRLLLLNTPHNPTGRVFDDQELEYVASLCLQHGVRVITDEVYEHIVYAPAKHRAFASLPGMRSRTLSLSSLGKTFSFTGWKIGWATGPKDMIAAAQSAHQFLTFAVATPLQRAAAFALRELAAEFVQELQQEYGERRSFLMGALENAGFVPLAPEGAYFVLADFTALHDGDDKSFVKHLIETIGVAAIPPSVFYARDQAAGRKLVRFAFCKRRETLEDAARRLEGLKR
ncbi:MAG: aminotransferase class I/II-fold pyridoxal phosphate-dependent enzyme, partial [Planctomycetes bacterium]|nr:aminotransferase class I/II-fold pyridoxal phosphate-dependent enzyme [Planctomycetota bacterium]